MEPFRLKVDEYIPGIAAITGLGEVTAVGNAELLREPRAAIFNSRQGKTPESNAPWIKMTMDLVAELLKHNAVILSSVGMNTWELLTWRVGAEGGSLILVVPEIESSVIMGMARNIIEDFQLEGSRLLIIFPDLETTPEEKYRRFPKRDFWIAALADRIYPVSVRPSGNLARLVELFSIIPDRVSDKFKVDYVKPAGTGFHPEKLAIFEPDFTGDWDYLTHWTRTAIDPWPGESKAEYFRSIVEGAGGYTHSGFNTLCRILRDLQIVGSDRLIRGDYRMVSFTESPPWELCKLIKWRPQLLRWTFEPYGIAIKKDKLSALGARKVVYGLDYQYRFLQGDDKAYFQAYDPEGNNWREEREWRYMGNLDLRRFNPEDVKVMVHTFDEAEKLGEWSPFPVVWWEELGNKK